MKTIVASPKPTIMPQSVITRTQMAICEGCGSPIVKIAQLTTIEVEMGGVKLEILQTSNYISSWMHAITQDTKCEEPMNVETSERGNPPDDED